VIEKGIGGDAFQPQGIHKDIQALDKFSHETETSSDHPRGKAGLHGFDLFGKVSRSCSIERIPPQLIHINIKPFRKRIVDDEKVKMEALHEGFERDLTRKDAVFISCTILDFNTCKILVRGKDPPDDPLSILVEKGFRIDLVVLED
jgi:hypothetical protein